MYLLKFGHKLNVDIFLTTMPTNGMVRNGPNGCDKKKEKNICSIAFTFIVYNLQSQSLVDKKG